MLLMKDLINGIEDEEMIKMLRQVSICDFTKCIAQFAGLNIAEVDDNVIKHYLLTWAKNKLKFFKKMGGKLRVDSKISYKNKDVDKTGEYHSLCKDFPTYSPWLEEFSYLPTNKISSIGEIGYSMRERIRKYIPECRSLEGMTITHFFKKYLKAPDELVTALGRIYENNNIEAIHTISINPIDIMLASENPYNWTSCYRLELFIDCSHADGCLAAVLDDSSLITYVWTKEGSYNLYDTFFFKSNIRYYHMRQFISIEPTKMEAIHFNAVYPAKDAYGADFLKVMREKVEFFLDPDAVWTRNNCCSCWRKNPYGYGEFDNDNIYKIKKAKDEEWLVYNEDIECPDGCGDILYGSDYAGNLFYNGDGFRAECFVSDDADWEEDMY